MCGATSRRRTGQERDFRERDRPFEEDYEGLQFHSGDTSQNSGGTISFRERWERDMSRDISDTRVDHSHKQM